MNRESHGVMVFGPQGNYMQVIIEYIDDLIWFGFKRWKKDLNDLLEEDNEERKQLMVTEFVNTFMTITGIVTLFTNCMCSKPDIVRELGGRINDCTSLP